MDVRAGTAAALSVADGQVDLVLNRQGALDPSEIAQVLAPQGVFLTQRHTLGLVARLRKKLRSVWTAPGTCTLAEARAATISNADTLTCGFLV